MLTSAQSRSFITMSSTTDTAPDRAPAAVRKLEQRGEDNGREPHEWPPNGRCRRRIAPMIDPVPRWRAHLLRQPVSHRKAPGMNFFYASSSANAGDVVCAVLSWKLGEALPDALAVAGRTPPPHGRIDASSSSNERITTSQPGARQEWSNNNKRREPRRQLGRNHKSLRTIGTLYPTGRPFWWGCFLCVVAKSVPRGRHGTLRRVIGDVSLSDQVTRRSRSMDWEDLTLVAKDRKGLRGIEGETRCGATCLVAKCRLLPAAVEMPRKASCRVIAHLRCPAVCGSFVLLQHSA